MSFPSLSARKVATPSPTLQAKNRSNTLIYYIINAIALCGAMAFCFGVVWRLFLDVADGNLILVPEAFDVVLLAQDRLDGSIE